MSHIKERLKQYKDELSKHSRYEAILVGTVMAMLKELQDDLEQDDKRTGRLRTLSEIQEDVRALTRVPSEFIHAKLDELAEEIGELVNNQWIPVEERLPEEHDSIYAKYKGTPEWRRYMFEKTSEYVLVTLNFKDGNIITFARTVDGEWKKETSFLGRVVIAWMPFPEPYKED